MTIEATMETCKKSLRIGKPYLHKTLGRVVIRVNGKVKMNSHYIYFLNTGEWPDWKNKREIIHHKDGNVLNDSFDNLELMIHGEHGSLHFSGRDNPFYGKKHSEETKQRMTEAQRGEKGNNWQGDSASAYAKYHRHFREPDKYPPLTEKECKELRAYWRKARKSKKDNDYN